ncbi:bacillithiol biosynthesis deacetylase BshB1 [Rhodohalobacter sp. SW132]|uniref:bacillithiol biosynthesis deacetylase BshB1 n=1 Tax=Rhodohalobacter sp. SW132 TaxID=2293433 RepID=UPI000E24D422|nr:bacillithiol biosynthesis deacetylase BshB1 [Rhodohalobacter sp. SW132]REL38373.1 bacillithiol biosynthesis deacetylase BshB1 [Rhodohalobacter sp. SW132]
MKADILAFGAHPDDTELGCAGTLAALVQKNRSVVVADLTRGEMGSRGTAKLRLQEAEKAASIIGLSDRLNLGLPDTELSNIREFQIPIIEVIRHFRPHICILPAPADRHPDHGNAARLISDAIFYSGLIKIETKNRAGNVQNPHRPAHILHYMQDRPFEPDFIFDITNTLSIKEKAIKAFTSQFDVADPGDEPETYISDPSFFDALRSRAKHMGHLAGFEYGEAFKYAQKPFPMNSLNFLMDTSPLR